MSTEDILYSPIKRQSAGRVFENFTAEPATNNPAPFADTPGPDARPTKHSQHYVELHRQRQQEMNEKLEATINAQRQRGYEQYQQAQQQSLQQQFEQALQNQTFQQTVQSHYGLGYQNLYANTTAGTSSGLNQANLGSYQGISGIAASNSLAAYNGIFSNTAAANTKCFAETAAPQRCPITGRNTITEAQAMAKIASFL